jgi:hypothetical protein
MHPEHLRQLAADHNRELLRDAAAARLARESRRRRRAPVPPDSGAGEAFSPVPRTAWSMP